MIARAVVLLVLLVMLTVCLVFLFRSLHPKKDPATAAKTESESSVQETEGGETDSSAESSDGTDYASISVPEMAEAANYASTNKEASLAKAAKLAAMYDYDTAIAVIQGYEGYQEDADCKEFIGRYTNAKASLVPVDVENVPHVFYHSLVNDYRGFSIDLQGDMVAKGNNCWMTTTGEFNTITQQMYDAG